MFRLFEKRRKKIGGFIGSAGLESWWLGEFDDDERLRIDQTYRPMGSSLDVESILTTGPIQKTGFDAARTLSTVATWFKQPEDRTIAYRFVQKAEEFLPQSKNVLTAHFFYQAKCQAYYRWREEDDFALQRAIEACENQIAISSQVAKHFQDSADWGLMPSHYGFKQLAIIMQKAGRLKVALQYCEKARGEGWKGDWDKRIARLSKQIEKQSRTSPS